MPECGTEANSCWKHSWGSLTLSHAVPFGLCWSVSVNKEEEMWVKSTIMERSEGHRSKLLSRFPWCNFSVPEGQLHDRRKIGLASEYRSFCFFLCYILSFLAVMMTLTCPDIPPRDTHQLRWVILIFVMNTNSRAARNTLGWLHAIRNDYTMNLPLV